jgi:stress response protein YsnF/sporulation protein YlmC with PRC-barrel domain
MNGQTAAKKVEVGKHDFRIRVLLEKLKNKLDHYTVLDRSGIIVGEVKDVKLDRERQLNLVVQDESYGSSEPFFLRSKYIQQVDSVTKSLFVDVSKADLKVVSVPERAKLLAVETVPSSASTATIIPEVVSSEVYKESEASVKESSFHRVASGEEIRYHAGDIPTPVKPEYNYEKSEMEDSLSSNERDIVEEEVIRLLAERVIVDTNKRKVGEVVVRKQVETRMVEVPVRYEKLIVEQVGSENKPLAEIVLGTGEVTGVDLTQNTISQERSRSHPTVSGEFKSPKSASLFLNAIALQRDSGCAKVRVELVLENPELEKTYQEWFARCAGS